MLILNLLANLIQHNSYVYKYITVMYVYILHVQLKGSLKRKFFFLLY